MSADIIFANWKEHAQEDYQKTRFTKVVAKELLDLLLEKFIASGIELDEVKVYKRRVVDFLVTEEGKRGGKNKRTGRDYKDWVQNVEDMYKSAIGDHYPMGVVAGDGIKRTGSVIEVDPFTEVLMSNNLVRAWVEHKFGRLDDALLLETCKDSTSLNLQMQNELFNSEWSRSGENMPEWIKKVLA
jgi:hypothetical protein